MRRLLVIVLLFVATPARADDPWQAGVSADVQAKANSLFAEANALFAREAHGRALEKYREAITLWDHPLIRFNLAVTLIRLDRILEAAANLDGALRYGAAPFQPETYRQALDYQRLVRGRVAIVRARCAQDGVQVALDGKAWLRCPADNHQRVLSGEHLLVAQQDGYQTKMQTIDMKSSCPSFSSC